MSRKIGLEGEKEAARYLRKKGYHILEKNFRTNGGEVDIVARDGETLVFVEVKSRRGIQFGEGHWAVDMKKRRHLTQAALLYMLKHGIQDRLCRFDLVVIENKGNELKKSHVALIQNAFDAEFQGVGRGAGQ